MGKETTREGQERAENGDFPRSQVTTGPGKAGPERGPSAQPSTRPGALFVCGAEVSLTGRILCLSGKICRQGVVNREPGLGLAGKTRFRRRGDLLPGRWRSAGEPWSRALPATDLPGQAESRRGAAPEK